MYASALHEAATPSSIGSDGGAASAPAVANGTMPSPALMVRSRSRVGKASSSRLANPAQMRRRSRSSTSAAPIDTPRPSHSPTRNAAPTTATRRR